LKIWWRRRVAEHALRLIKSLRRLEASQPPVCAFLNGELKEGSFGLGDNIKGSVVSFFPHCPGEEHEKYIPFFTVGAPGS
jgi:hypothetical protein